jgi:hypothetical protein
LREEDTLKSRKSRKGTSVADKPETDKLAILPDGRRRSGAHSAGVGCKRKRYLKTVDFFLGKYWSQKLSP